MNYRRGFQRVYAVLTVTWIGVLMLVLPSYRLEFWHDWPLVVDPSQVSLVSPPIDYGKTVPPSPPPSTLTDADIDAHDRASKTQSPSKDWFARNAPPGSSNGGWDSTANHVALPPDAVLVDPGSEPLRVVKSDPLPSPPFSDSRTGKALWLAGVLFGPPLIGYAAIFLVIPWIYRGFRPSVI